MKRNLLIALCLFALAACAAPAPSLVLGDAWDYQLTTADLPAGWALTDQALQTAVDLSRPPDADPAAPVITSTVPAGSLHNVEQLYTARYTPPEDSGYADFTLQILLYRTTADAQAGVSAESPGTDWERVDTSTVGEQSQVWRYTPPDIDVDQGLYRVDFRYLNAVGSVTMFGSADVLPGPDEPLRYAQQVVDKLKAGAEPAALRDLLKAGVPDLRPRLLGQAQLAALDPALGERWIISDQYLGGWTLNSDFSEGARAALDQLGRVAGYQLYMVKPVNADEFDQMAGSALFQQISAYRQAASAPRGLRAMIGLPGAAELSAPPSVGESARAWSQVMASTDGASIAVTEISFAVGRYVATVQLQSPPLSAEADQQTVLADNLALARALAQALADNLAE